MVVFVKEWHKLQKIFIINITKINIQSPILLLQAFGDFMEIKVVPLNTLQLHE